MEKVKYHKFLKNFYLFFIAVYNSVLAAFYFSGIMYSWSDDPSVDAELVYSVYGNSLKILDIVYACLLGVGTILALIARHRISKGFKDGVHLTCGLFVFQGVIPFVYSVWGHTILEDASIINLNDVFFLCVYLGVAFLTFKYYSKRKAMFNN